MSAKRTWMVCAAVAGALLVGGCGGGDGDDGGLSTDEKLATIQARADVQDFCSLYKSPGELYDRTLESMLTAVRDLSRIYRENAADAKVEISIENKSFTLRQLVQEQARALRKCGRDGRQQSGVLEVALQQKAQS
jgi:hypothetical protein